MRVYSCMYVSRYMHVCMCVCVCVYVWKCVYGTVCTKCACVHECINVCIYTCARVGVYVCVCVCVCVCVYDMRVHVYLEKKPPIYCYKNTLVFTDRSTFSKDSPLLNLLRRITAELTFENTLKYVY